MKKFVFILSLAAACVLTGCGGNTPEAISKKWCELNAKLEKAEGDEREKLKEEMHAFEDKVEKEHEGDEKFMDKVKELTSACDN